MTPICLNISRRYTKKNTTFSSKTQICGFSTQIPLYLQILEQGWVPFCPVAVSEEGFGIDLQLYFN